MGKGKNGDEPTENLPAVATYTTKVISTDEGNGIVVVETDAPDGTGFTALIDGESVDANAEAGQIWFYVDRALRPEPMVELK